MIVEKYKLGNTTIKIADDACKRTPEEINTILSKLTKIAWPYVKAEKNTGKKMQTQIIKNYGEGNE